MKQEKDLFYTPGTLMPILGKSKSYCYKLIQDLNKDLKNKGYRTINGRVPKTYFNEVFNIRKDKLK